MTELLITYAQFLCSSALLVAFYWLVLRHRASYKLSRLYLIGVPMLSAMMCGLKFEVEVPATPFLSETEAVAQQMTPSLRNEEPQYVTMPDETAASTSTTPLNNTVSAEVHTDVVNSFTIDCATIIRLVVPLISLLLLLFAAFYIVKLLRIKRKMFAETTAEGYDLIRSSSVHTPFSFGKTIFLPEGWKMTASHTSSVTRRRTSLTGII